MSAARKRLFKIKKALVRTTHSQVTLKNGRKLTLSPYVYLRRGDTLRFSPSVTDFHTIHKMFQDRATKCLKHVRVFPPYQANEVVHVPPHVLRIRFKERTHPKEWRAAKVLEQFHYRGKGFNRLVGRRIVLIAECNQFGVIAYGVLSATVGMAKPRFGLFKTNFTQQMRSGLINQIARIPRIVVHPEFRGMGLGVLMARHLVRFAKLHWDINRYKPIMVEVIAKMTEYHKFFERAGFIRLGDTEGYEEGIIPQYGNGAWEERNFKRYDFMGNQGAKPYLIWPLTSDVSRRIRTLLKSRRPQVDLVDAPRASVRPIHFKSINISYRVTNGHTVRSRVVKEAFGVDASQLKSTVIQDLNLVIQPGDVVLVTGASGSGKSTLLKPICHSGNWIRKHMHFRGKILGRAPRSVAALSTSFESDRPLIEQICKTRDVRHAIELLNSVGLAEAHLYVKSPSQVSDGQRYRFAVARLCDSGKPVWVADEFASTLSPEMAAVVAKGLRRLARLHGATVILAAPHIEHFAPSLVPNKLVRLSWGGRATVHAVRADWVDLGSSISLSLTNQSSQALTNLQLGSLDLKGSFIHLRTRQNLPAGSAWRVVVSKIELGQAIALRAHCDQGIGDVAYLRSR